MTITTTWRKSPGITRYVKYDGAGIYHWCEVGEDQRFDCARGTCTIDELSPDISFKAIERRNAGVWPFYVDWPLK